MTKLCDCNELTAIHVAADYGADPLWCAVCHLNLDIEDFELSDSLSTDLMRWTNRFGEWLDLETDQLLDGGEALLELHNSEGQFLTKRLSSELPLYQFKFITS